MSLKIYSKINHKERKLKNKIIKINIKLDIFCVMKYRTK